jgi:hypothetical protein
VRRRGRDQARLRHFSAPGRLLRALLARRGAVLVNLVGREGRRDLAILRETRKRAPLLIGDAAALQILSAVRAARPLGGAMAEAGVLMGGAARLICEAKGDAPLHLFDVFETLQRPADALSTQREAELRAHFGGLHGRRAQVERLLEAYGGVGFHVGIFPASARGLEAVRFSFVHIDLDLEPSTRDALEYFLPRMVEGGIVIGDDYGDPGVRGVFAACFAGRPDTLIELPWGQVMVIMARS